MENQIDVVEDAMKREKEIRKEYNKTYYVKNRQKVLAHAKEKITCNGCGCQVGKNSLARHIKSKNHRLAVFERAANQNQ